jgi:hypothetical protein
MKKIVIISPDTVALPLKENHPATIKEGNREYKIEDKCQKMAAIGKRSWRFAEYLSKHNDFDVTLLVPDVNFPPKEFIDTSKINFKVDSYNFKSANWEWSDALDRQLKNADFVIVQTVTGTGFLNSAVLPRSVNVIVDGWVPFLAELPCVLLSYPRIYRKIHWTTKFLPQYKDMLTRANCILYANDRQQYYYEGQFFIMEKLDWTAFKFSPLLKIPYGVDKVTTIPKKEDTSTLSLLWYGPIYPWYFPEILIEQLANIENIKIDFIGVRHPRYQRIYNTYYKKFFDTVAATSNMTVIEDYDYKLDQVELFKKYDAGIIIARNWLEETYSHRCRIIEMAAAGLPVIVNKGNSLYEESECLKPLLHPVSLENIKEDIINLANNKQKFNISTENLDTIYQNLNWERVLNPLVEYIRKFS